ncbi:MAG: hypothetical protein Q4F03_10625 [Eubacteriales bacterium]|nr:hypothetical protein [Eubacteriales bacterium]
MRVSVKKLQKEFGIIYNGEHEKSGIVGIKIYGIKTITSIFMWKTRKEEETMRAHAKEMVFPIGVPNETYKLLK